MKKLKRYIAIVGAFACAVSGLAAAQTTTGTDTWRCGNTYTDQPCTGGKAVNVDDARSAAEQRAAERQVRDAGRHADALARERRALEARSVNQGPAVIARPEPAFAQPSPRADKVASKPRLDKPKKPRMAGDAFTAHDPSNPPATKKKRRQQSSAG